MNKFDKVDKAYKKALKVVESCKTQKHVSITRKYIRLFDNTIERLFPKMTFQSLKYKKDREAVRRLRLVLEYRLTAKLLNIKEQI